MRFRHRVVLFALAAGVAGGLPVQAQTVCSGDVIQGKRVVQVLYESPDAKCDGDGCGEESSDYVE